MHRISGIPTLQFGKSRFDAREEAWKERKLSPREIAWSDSRRPFWEVRELNQERFTRDRERIDRHKSPSQLEREKFWEDKK